MAGITAGIAASTAMHAATRKPCSFCSHHGFTFLSRVVRQRGSRPCYLTFLSPGLKQFFLQCLGFSVFPKMCSAFKFKLFVVANCCPSHNCKFDVFTDSNKTVPGKGFKFRLSFPAVFFVTNIASKFQRTDSPTDCFCLCLFPCKKSGLCFQFSNSKNSVFVIRSNGDTFR